MLSSVTYKQTHKQTIAATNNTTIDQNEKRDEMKRGKVNT